jgi:hypothetical protein
MASAILMSLAVLALAAATGWHALASAAGADWFVEWFGAEAL